MSQNTPLSQLRQPISNWSRDDWYSTIALAVVICSALAMLSYLLVISTLDNSNSDPLTLSPISDKSVNEGSLLQFTISVENPDNDTLVFTASNLPEGANFNTETGSFTWMPNYAQEGNYSSIHFEVSNGDEISSENIAIAVLQPTESTDVNQDGDIDIADVTSIHQRCGEIGTAGWIPEDVNEDGTINVLDMIPIGQYVSEASNM